MMAKKKVQDPPEGDFRCVPTNVANPEEWGVLNVRRNDEGFVQRRYRTFYEAITFAAYETAEHKTEVKRL